MSNSRDELNSLPLFSIVIPARNEEKHLPRCLEAISVSRNRLQSEISSPPEQINEIIVVVNRSTDRTEDIARQAGCRVITNDAKNLSQIRNAGAAVARGRYLITIDADSWMSPNMLSSVYHQLENPGVIGGGVALFPERLSLGIFLTGLALLPIVLWYRISAGLFFCRREDFHAIGGFDESLASIEDLDFARRLRLFGKQQSKSFVTLFRAYITTSCRKFDHFGDWYFLKNPRMSFELLKGRHQAHADKIWYDFKR